MKIRIINNLIINQHAFKIITTAADISATTTSTTTSTATDTNY